MILTMTKYHVNLPRDSPLSLLFIVKVFSSFETKLVLKISNETFSRITRFLMQLDYPVEKRICITPYPEAYETHVGTSSRQAHLSYTRATYLSHYAAGIKSNHEARLPWTIKVRLHVPAGLLVEHSSTWITHLPYTLPETYNAASSI